MLIILTVQVLEGDIQSLKRAGTVGFQGAVYGMKFQVDPYELTALWPSNVDGEYNIEQSLHM